MFSLFPTNPKQAKEAFAQGDEVFWAWKKVCYELKRERLIFYILKGWRKIQGKGGVILVDAMGKNKEILIHGELFYYQMSKGFKQGIVVGVITKVMTLEDGNEVSFLQHIKFF